MEETGCDVLIHEFLGTLSYEVGRKPKIVQFWRMEALDGPERKLMRDVRAVKWLPLETAIKKLSHPREQLFLSGVGLTAIRAARAKSPARWRRVGRSQIVNRIRAWWREARERKRKRKR